MTIGTIAPYALSITAPAIMKELSIGINLSPQFPEIDLQVEATTERLDRYLAEQLPDLSR
jgi:hypothetical protein